MAKFLSFLICFFFFSFPLFASTSIPDESLIRDAEIEDVLKSFIHPLFEAAKLNPESLRLYIISSKEVNAFAMSGGRIAMNTGLLLKATSALQVIGVLAHETAHIAGKHVIRGVDAYEKALLQGLLGAVGGIGVGLINPEVGMGVLMGSLEMAKRGFLKFSQTQEGAADQGAAKYLDSLNWSSRGLLEFMEILRKDDFLADQHVDPYVLTHPLVTERLDFFRTHLSNSIHAEKSLPDPFEERFKRIQIKIAAFTQSPVKIFAKFKPTDKSSLARYGRSIAYFQASQIDEALKELDSLLKEFPDDPFYWDLKGQILFDAGKISEAIVAYEKAVNLRPDIPLLHLNLAHALIEGGEAKHIEKAYMELMRVKTQEPDNPFAYRLLAIIYGKQEKTGLAALCLAEMGLEVGDLDQAEQQGKRALHFLKEDPLNHTRAKDILEEVERLKALEEWF